MAHLSICCLGSFQVILDDRPITDFKSIKIQALLAYLAVEADRPHRREVLAGLLWPDWPDRSALSNLRYALSDLRRAIGDRTAKPPHLLISRETLQFNVSSDYRLDVEDFLTATGPVESMEACFQDTAGVAEAIQSYRGEFLEGFSIKDSDLFEDWARLKRQQIGQRYMSSLRFLVNAHEQRGHYEEALLWARRQLELEPWDEAGHRQMMRILALNGQRGEALNQFDVCRQILAEELEVEPSQETVRLFEEIRNAQFHVPVRTPAMPVSQAINLPSFLEEKPPNLEASFFVARQSEMAQLEGFLNLSLGCQGRVSFVTGESGSGKTSLIQEFSRRSQEVHADLIVVNGNCNAYTGIGDPYLPFREVFEMLCGDIESKWAAGAITGDHARRLWEMMPVTTQAVVEVGQGLVGTFVKQVSLLERLLESGQAPAQLEKLKIRLVPPQNRAATIPDAITQQQSDLFEQVTKVLQILSQYRPLLILIDDLQWADPGTVSLLFHLGRHLSGYPILVVGAYRPEEIALGRNGERHPLQPLINEFQRDFGDILVSLDRADRQEFMEALLESEPNQLGDVFRERLYRQTWGHPLFTVELLRGLQERGDLVYSPKEGWVEGLELDWETLPARVEAAIAERIGRLAQPLQAMLKAACVEGEVFTAEVVARVLSADNREVVSHLSGVLDRQHRLIRAQSIERLGPRRVSRYRFRNYLFQKYLYDSLDEVEQTYFHEDVGSALEELYGGHADDFAVPLAWHFQEAGMSGKAVRYLYLAGNKAVQMCAYQEGLNHLERALELLEPLPNTTENMRQEFDLQIAIGIASAGFEGARVPAVKNAYTRARELCYQLNDTTQLCKVLGGMAEFHYVGAEHQKAWELGEEALRLAQGTENQLELIFGYWYLGFVAFILGDFTTAHSHLEKVISLYEPHRHHQALVKLRGKDPGLGALAYDSCCLWCLGYPDQGFERGQEAFSLVRAFDHAFSFADVLCFSGCLFQEMCRDGAALKEAAEELIELSDEKVPGWGDVGMSYKGEASVFLGQLQEGITQIKEGLQIKQVAGTRVYNSAPLAILSQAQAATGQIEVAIKTLMEALAFIEETNERYWEAEVYRNWGDLLLMQGQGVDAESKYQNAIDIARSQSARMLELRSATSLARLWQKQGRSDEACQILSVIYGWFTEGFGTPDLIEAKALLEEMS